MFGSQTSETGCETPVRQSDSLTGSKSSLTSSLTFVLQSLVDVHTLISLDATTADTAFVSSFDSGALVAPEPSAVVLTVCGLALLVLLRRGRAT